MAAWSRYDTDKPRSCGPVTLANVLSDLGYHVSRGLFDKIISMTLKGSSGGTNKKAFMKTIDKIFPEEVSVSIIPSVSSPRELYHYASLSSRYPGAYATAIAMKFDEHAFKEGVVEHHLDTMKTGWYRGQYCVYTPGQEKHLNSWHVSNLLRDANVKVYIFKRNNIRYI
jgi:hypothetical protein